MKKIFTSVLISILLVLTLTLCACGNENIELSTTEIEVAVDNFESFYFSASEKSKFEVISSDETIASVSSVQRSSGSTSNYVVATVRGQSVGECSMSVKVGNATKSVSVKVGFIPEINLLQTDDYSFQIKTNFPAGTNLMLTLSGNGYKKSQGLTLEKQSWYYSYKNFTVEEVANGNYTLSVQLGDFADQPQETKDRLGNIGEFILGEFITDNNGVKTLEAKFIFELPYVSTEEKIAATDYLSLSKEQKLFIKKWIDARYDYYDEIDGKYTGEKYTKTIFNEAATLFNKSYNEIQWIWSDPDVPLYD